MADGDSPLYVVHGSWRQLGSERLLNLNGSTCCDHRRGHNRRDVTRRRSDKCSPCGRGSAKRGYTAARPAGCGSSAALDSEQPRQRSERPDRRGQSCQLATDAPKLRAVVPTPGAVVQVTARNAACTDATVVGSCQLGADLLACGISRFDSGREADSGPNQQRLHRRDGQVQHPGDLAVGHPTQLAHQKRRTLLVGKAANIDDQPAQRLAMLTLHHRVAGQAGSQLKCLENGRHRPPELVNAAVVGDAVQPGPQAQLAAVGAQAGVRTNEHVLEHILGVGM